MNWTLSPGDVLAHYRVIAPLGSGGMGQVFLAEDVRLGRKLALKVLAPRSGGAEDLLGRFEREARSVSALNHPNIITIYDTGHARGLPFIATEFIDGVTLRTLLGRGRIGVRQALDIAIQVSQALVAAHATGVVHRDLKPENVMVRLDGYVKVLDFGLAKLTGPAIGTVSGDAATCVPETAGGLVMGTVRYMAPEQARGEEIDARADLFALGVVLYEMLSGEPPFKGGTAADLIGALLLQDVPPIAGVPAELDRVVRTAIRKQRHERQASCAQLLEELRSALRQIETRPLGDTPLPIWQESVTMAYTPEMLTPVGATTPARGAGAAAAVAKRRRTRRTIESLAVLPLVNDGENRELTYLGDGLTESLINSLSQMPRLRVMARSTVFRYRGGVTDPQAVGRELGVQAALTGQVRERGEAVVVSVELIDVADGSQLWGSVLHRLPSDLFTLQAELTRELTDALRLRLTREQKKRLNRRHTASPAAYQLYLRGRYLSNERTATALREAQALFERAVAEDPAYALAYAGLADCRSLLAVSQRSASVGTVIRQAREAALKALELDDTLAEGHASLAFIKFRFDWEWMRAEAEFARAIELNPGHAPSRQWHAMFLASRSRFDAALAEMRVALDLDPLSLVIQAGIGRILHFARRFEDAATQYAHVLQTNPSFGQAHVDLALTHLATGRHADARASLDRAEALMGDVSTILLLRGVCAVREGAAEDGRRILHDLQARHERGDAGLDDLALLAATLGDWPRALPWLREACARRSPFLGYVDVEPAMAPLLTHPDARALLQQHGFDGVP